jgi:hypothetical protein
MGSLTPRLQKDWQIYPNVRLTPFVSLLATMGWWAYENKVRLLGANGWTMVWSSDGTTGPASAGDNTDRITSAAAFATRATVAAAPQSWFIVENSLGCQLLFSYLGASDDICSVHYSQGGLFTIPGTPTHQPQAVDQAKLVYATSIISSTASDDRVMSIWVEQDSWAMAVFRAGTLLQYMGLESFDSAVDPTIQASPMVAFRFAPGGLIANASHSLITLGNTHPIEIPASWNGAFTFHNYNGIYKYTRFAVPYAGWVTQSFGYSTVPNTNPWQTSTNTPRLQNNAAIGLVPVIFNGITSGQSFAAADTENWGYGGIAQDWWWGINHNTLMNDVFSGYEQGDLITDPPRSNWLIAIGPGVIRPWKDASGLGMLTA